MIQQPHDSELIASRDAFFGVLASNGFHLGHMDDATRGRF
jgi:hypothetical protein